MPVKRRISKTRRVEVNPEMRAYLTDELEDVFFFDDPEIIDAWQQLEGEIVEQWILTRPGSRPRAWWRLSAPKPGRQTIGRRNRMCVPCAPPSPADQRRFLRRHKLLLPGEEERLAD